MEISRYDMLRHFADSWGLLFMVGIFLAAIILVLLPGAKERAAEAARIPLDDKNPGDRR